MGVSGQPHALDTSPWKRNVVPTEQEAGWALKLVHMVLGKRYRMISSYSIQCQAWKWTKSLFPFLDITVLNSFLLLGACGTKVTLTVTSLVQILM